VAAHGHTSLPVVAPTLPPRAIEAATPWLLLRAFANGTTAMTGIEAVSNAVPLFREARVARARRTLTGIVLLLIALLVGIALLCRSYDVTATPPGATGYESVLSQLTAAVLGRGLGYGFCMASVVVVLALSANTSFADFPRVARLLAGDRFLPELFEHRGRRLVFSYGILVLAALSAVVLIAFGGVTDRLIPLYAVGALLAFTMSQAGMVVHWHKAKVHGPRLWVNAVGATATGVTVLLVIASKFVEGAWFSLVVILALMALFAALRRKYERIERAMQTEAPLELGDPLPTTAIVPIRRWDRMSSKTLRWAIGMASEVVAVQVLADDRPEEDLAARWHDLVEVPAEKAGLAPPRLLVERSDYRALFQPLVACVTRLAAEHPERQVAVIVPELVEHRWYRALFLLDIASVLRAKLLQRGGPPVVVISAPWYVRDWA
jgi:hypothetical protein